MIIITLFHSSGSSVLFYDVFVVDHDADDDDDDGEWLNVYYCDFIV